ncbi:MAG: type III pantothenate kinase [Neptuniibacter sp.]
MILEIDAGNTFIKWRLLDGSIVTERGKLKTDSDQWTFPIHWSDVDVVRIASVAGDSVQERLVSFIQNKNNSIELRLALTEAKAAGVVNSYSDPSRMGVDRWLVMLAAYNDCKKACCIVDCGSAITVDYVDAGGKHLGGYIIPGLRLLSSTLLENTAEIIVDQDIDAFNLMPGRHTSAAVKHGVNYMFNALCHQITDELHRSDEQWELYVTGGDGELFAQLAGCDNYIPDLVMDGLSWSVG